MEGYNGAGGVITGSSSSQGCSPHAWVGTASALVLVTRSLSPVGVHLSNRGAVRLLWGEQVAEVGGRECRRGEGGEPSVTPPRAAPKPRQVLIKAGLVKMCQ